MFYVCHKVTVFQLMTKKELKNNFNKSAFTISKNDIIHANMLICFNVYM